MTRIVKAFAFLRSFQKIIAISSIVLSALYLILGNPSLATMHLMMGLYLLLSSFQKVEDERSSSLRYTSLYVSLVFSYTVKMVSSFLYDKQLISYRMTDINHFIILVLLIANITYYVRLYAGRS
jgi:hypothetical protein